MNEICYSAENAFKTRFEAVKTAYNRDDHRGAIYGLADCMQSIMVNKKGVRPNCTSGLINESEEKEGLTGRDGEFLRREYYLNIVGIDEKMRSATRDELNLFLVLADPDILDNEKVQAAFFDRLSTLQKEEMAQKVSQNKGDDSNLESQHEEETKQYAQFFGFFKGAVKVHSINAFFPAGYVSEDSFSERD